MSPRLDLPLRLISSVVLTPRFCRKFITWLLSFLVSWLHAVGSCTSWLAVAVIQAYSVDSMLSDDHWSKIPLIPLIAACPAWLQLRNWKIINFMIWVRVDHNWGKQINYQGSTKYSLDNSDSVTSKTILRKSASHSLAQPDACSVLLVDFFSVLVRHPHCSGIPTLHEK